MIPMIGREIGAVDHGKGVDDAGAAQGIVAVHGKLYYLTQQLTLITVGHENARVDRNVNRVGNEHDDHEAKVELKNSLHTTPSLMAALFIPHTI